MKIFLPSLLIGLIALGCANDRPSDAPVRSTEANEQPPSPASTAGLFSPSEACNYPNKAKNPAMRSLAGGN